MMRVRGFWGGVLAVAWLALAGAASAAPSRLFTDDAPLQMTISGPFPALVAASKSGANPYPGTLTLSDAGGPAQTFAVTLKPRGHFRRTSGGCKFPPLWLEFDKGAVKGTALHGQHKLKLVTYCRDAADYEQRIVLEYLAYRMYNVLTPMSFRVRAAQVTYRNSGGTDSVTRFGFLIEDIDDVADRNDRDKLEALTHQIKVTQLDAHAAARAALFEYMIGNLDWEFLAAPAGDDCCHNARPIAARDATVASASAVVPVPYDFDYSGLVDAPYAGPPPGTTIERLTERLYRGYCFSNGEIASAAAEFKAQRGAMMAVINSEPRLTGAFRGKAVKFLDGFFATLDDPAKLTRQTIGHCR
jgi:hypothetical protein